MPRPSRDKKREQKRSAPSAVPVAAPIDVRVPVTGPGAGGAWIGGVPVAAAEGEEIQQTVLGHLHRIALATGHPVLATVHDERIGFAVPIRVSVDGASEFVGPPTPLPTNEAPSPHAVPATDPVPPAEPERPRRDKPTHVLRALEEQKPPGGTPDRTVPLRAVPEPKTGPQKLDAQPSPAAPYASTSAPTYVLRAVPEATADTSPQAPTPEPAEPRRPSTPLPPAPPRPAPHGGPAADNPYALPHPPEPVRQPTPAEAPQPTANTFVLRAVPEQSPPTAQPASAQELPEAGPVTPGTVAAPTGAFGPPPSIAEPVWQAPETGSDKPRTLRPDSAAVVDAYAAPAPQQPAPPSRPVPVVEAVEEAVEEAVKEPPLRGFDAVAEAVLATDSGSLPPDGMGRMAAESLARINEAVKQGLINEAAVMAEQAVAETSATLGPDHSDVLRLHELTAYIAYLAGDALRSFHLSLDLAQRRHRLRDARGAYGNVQSAAAAWRAIRDPLQGLHLGRDLIGLWSELAAGNGPAADDVDQLEKARTRMNRLAARAREAAAGGRHA
ncbi:hypothetical protein AB0L85_27285 [Streptomyces sp. NPDC052051]|uniref:hypothetical protein n=1 Tax=Streptomyces sp. NPDC052051 TaxID=3154649 RepID=UPI00341ABDC4